MANRARAPQKNKPRAGEGAGLVAGAAQQAPLAGRDGYFFAALACAIAAWAAARRATGTRNGEHET